MPKKFVFRPKCEFEIEKSLKLSRGISISFNIDHFVASNHDIKEIMGLTKMDILKLYKALLKESSKFPNYNFRTYALRRIKSRFRENQCLSDVTEIDKYFNDGLKNLEIIKRQVIINNLYRPDKLVIEKEEEKS